MTTNVMPAYTAETWHTGVVGPSSWMRSCGGDNQRLATKHWRLLGARSQGEVHGFYVAQLRRRMGVTAVREFARHRLRRAAYVGVPRAVVEQMMQQEAMRVRLHGQPAAEPPYADFFAWAGQQPAAARGGGGG